MGSPEPPGDGGADDALRRLEERLDRASDAAERLLAEAAGSAARVARAAAGQTLPAAEGQASAAEGQTPGDAGRTPPTDPGRPPVAGWQLPREAAAPGQRGDFELLAQAIGSLRELIPPELERRLAEALRELLLALRALIDWYLERSERQRAAPAEVQDIPIS